MGEKYCRRLFINIGRFQKNNEVLFDNSEWVTMASAVSFPYSMLVELETHERGDVKRGQLIQKKLQLKYAIDDIGHLKCCNL